MQSWLAACECFGESFLQSVEIFFENHIDVKKMSSLGNEENENWKLAKILYTLNVQHKNRLKRKFRKLFLMPAIFLCVIHIVRFTPMCPSPTSIYERKWYAILEKLDDTKSSLNM